MLSDRITEVSADVFLVRGTDVNWVLLREGRDLTLIDSGWTGDLPLLLDSITAIGHHPRDVTAILLTHAHIDHTGGLNYFHLQYGTPVYMDAVEVAHARREYLEQAGPLDIARSIWRPGVLGWTVRVARVGALKDITVAHARRFPDQNSPLRNGPGQDSPERNAADGALDLPGRPVPVATHGHTSGHSAYLLPGAAAVVTGDGLVTGHAATGVQGPHLLGPMFNHSQLEALGALTPLEKLDADLVLPGHGPAHRGPIADAVATARDRARGQ